MPTDAVFLMPMAASHIDACAAIAACAPDPWKQGDLRAHLQSHYPAFTALYGDIPVAFACFRPQDEDTIDLSLVAVDPAHRKKNIATELLQYAFACLGTQGYARCLLEVRAGNAAALSLYKKLGFVALAKRPGLYAHPAEDGFILETLLYKGTLL